MKADRVLTYVYCLVHSRRRPVLRGVPAGVPGASAVRALDAGGGLWAVVSSVPAAEYDEAALARGLRSLEWVGRRAVAHEAVVEHFLRAPAVLPMKLLTLFTSDKRVLAHIARRRRRIDGLLAALAGQIEWGLRLTFDEKAVRAGVERRDAGAVRSGAAYLARKRDLLDIARTRLASARGEADRVFRSIAKTASAARRRTATERAAPGSRLLLDAAFLVPASRAGAFRAAVRHHARALTGSGIAVSLTGPWPPYNFVDAPRPKSRA